MKRSVVRRTQAAAPSSAVIGAGVFLAAPAQAGPATLWLQNDKTGLCLDDSSEYGLGAFPCNDAGELDGYQAWTLR